MAPTNVSPASPPDASAPTVRVVGTPEQRARNQAALDHFEERLKAAAAMTPAEIAEAEQEWQAFRRAINENRMSNRLRYVE